MQEFASTDAKDKWSLLTETALREPVTITHHGRPSLIVTSVQDYQALQRVKYSQLKTDIRRGLEDLKQGRISTKNLDKLIAEGKQRLRVTQKPRSGAFAKLTSNS